MGAFFVSWDLWAILSFCLVCSLIAIGCVAGVKVQLDNRRIRRYAALAASQAEVRENSLPSVVVSSADGDLEQGGVPFGIRALEQGVEVEGVWISRPNTPTPSLRATSRPPSLKGEPSAAHPRPAPLPELDMRRLRAMLPEQASAPSSRNSSREPSANFDRSSSMDLLGSSSSPYSLSSVTADGTTTQMLLDYHRNREKRPSLTRNSATLEVLEGKTTFHDTTLESSVAGDLEIPKSRYRRGSPTPMSSRSALPAASDEFLQNLAKQASKRLRSEEAAAQIDRLFQKHRSQQVAEEGFLPRNRRPASLQAFGKRRSEEDGEKDCSPEFYSVTPIPSPPLSATEAGIECSPGASPDLLPRGQTVSQDQFSDFESSPPTSHGNSQSSPRSRLTTSSPPSETSPMRRSDYLYLPADKNTNEIPGISLPPAFGTKRHSQVLRTVNSGFEIMVPGTFGQLAPEDVSIDDSGSKRRPRRLQKVSPGSRHTRISLDLEKFADIALAEDSGNKQRPKRLQKKRPHSTSSIPSANAIESAQAAR